MIACIGDKISCQFSYVVQPPTEALLRVSRSLPPLSQDELERSIDQLRARGVSLLWDDEGFVLQWPDVSEFPFRDPLSWADVEMVRVNFNNLRRRFQLRDIEIAFPTEIPLEKAPLVFCDIETTGQAKSDMICEFSLCLRIPGKRDEWFNSLINPGVPIRNSDIHHITDRDVAASPFFGDVADQVYHLVRRAVFISHSTNSFDESFLARELKTAGFDWKPPVKLSTCILAKRLLRTEPNHKLQDLAKSLKLPVQAAHRAESDVRTMIALFDRLRAVASKEYKAPKTLAHWMRL